MRREICFSLISLLLSAASYSWKPPECPVEVVASWAKFQATMRNATPTSLVFAPRPYPVVTADIMADLEFGFRRMFPDSAAVPERVRSLYLGIENRTLRPEVVRVQNWTPSRCSPGRESSFYYLVRLFEKPNGLELGRVAMFQSGLLAQWTIAPPNASRESRTEWSRRLTNPDEALLLAGSRLKLPGRNAQWVTTHGTGDLECPPIYPCVSFEAGGSSFIIAGRQVAYELFPESPRTSVQALKDDRARQATLDTLQGGDEGLVTVGSEQFVLARRVPLAP